MLKSISLKVSDVQRLLTIRRECIIKLCGDDHHGDKDEILNWADNKTVKKFEEMLCDDRLKFIGVSKVDKVVGFGSANDNGRILLNYIDPEYRFMGVSKHIMSALEKHFKDIGITELSLESSQTALTFYQKHGWQLNNGKNSKLEMHKTI